MGFKQRVVGPVAILALGLGSLGAWFLWSLSRGTEARVVAVPDPAEHGSPDAEDAGTGAERAGLAAPLGIEGIPATLAELRRVTAPADLEAVRAKLVAHWVAEVTDPVARENAGRLAVFLADAELRLGNGESALDKAERARAWLPEESAAHHVYSKALVVRMQEAGMLFAMKHLGDFKQALQTTIELDPANVDARVEQAAFYLMAPKLVGGNVEEGRKLARTLEPLDGARSAWLLAMAWLAEKENGKAIAACREALLAYPENADLSATLAQLVSETDVEEAIALYETALATGAVAQGEAYYRSLYALGRLLVEAEREPERALQLFDLYAAGRPAAGMMPPLAGAHWRRGQAFEQLGDRDAARGAYRKSLELDPDFEEAREALDLLDAAGTHVE